MISPTIIHPSLLGELAATGHFPDTGTVQAAARARVGREVTLTWANVAGLVDLECAQSPMSAEERRSEDHTYSDATHKVLLASYQPTITTEMRWVSGGVNYDILAAEPEQQDTYTRMRVRLVTN